MISGSGKNGAQTQNGTTNISPYYQNGVLPENLRILKNEQVLEHLAGIDPESLGQAAKKVVMLRGAGVGPSGIKNSFINSMQLLCWLERLKGY